MRHHVGKAWTLPFRLYLPPVRMLRQYVERTFLSLPYLIQSRSITSIPPGWTLSSIDDAKRWIADFRGHKSIKREDTEVTFARSSGPGGQHVNTTNSKAVVKLPLKSPQIPSWARDALRQSPSYVRSSDSLQTSSMTSRTQGANLDECLSKLHSIILKAATESVPTLPSVEQQERVKEFQKKEQVQRKEFKMKRKNVKRGRSAKWDD
ncbi:hypothetical protein FRB91_008575 [Serendipita sp. 411]|nr:hypothetical protein FRB91_008575 [Serendipita sp. 411]